MRKYSIIFTKFLLSMDLLFNMSNILTNFKYGLDSILDSMKLKKNDSILKLPRKLFIGIMKFIGYILYGLHSSVKRFFESIRDITNYYFGTELRFKINKNLDENDLSKKWYLYDVLTETSKSNLKSRLFKLKDLFTVYSKVSTRGNKYY
jgi:hypothetical protein